jgi:hypothetical protein
MKPLSLPFKGRQTKRIPVISDIVKITELVFTPPNCQQPSDAFDRTPRRPMPLLRSSGEIVRFSAVALHLPAHRADKCS